MSARITLRQGNPFGIAWKHSSALSSQTFNVVKAVGSEPRLLEQQAPVSAKWQDDASKFTGIWGRKWLNLSKSYGAAGNLPDVQTDVSRIA